MSKIIIPENYTPALNLYDTQRAIGTVKRLFADTLCATLNLYRVSAPLFVEASTGLNDDLNGVERKVTFDTKDSGIEVQVVQSLAKWKRKALKDYGFRVGKGLYCDMNAIRRDEDMDNLHSIYVDQWDWEKVIREEDRNETYLKNVVRSIVSAVCATEMNLHAMFPQLQDLPLHTPNVTFITTQELEDKYPGLTPKERENAIVKENGTTFLMKIGAPLKSGKPHDGRAPDYDDWDLNGDLLFWNEPLQCSYELSSMGIRVSPESMDRQLTAAGCDDRRELPFHKAVLNGELPYTIGGGIGQSRLCMLLLGSAHIGEVQASVWDNATRKPEKAGIPASVWDNATREACEKAGIPVCPLRHRRCHLSQRERQKLMHPQGPASFFLCPEFQTHLAFSPISAQPPEQEGVQQVRDEDDGKPHQRRLNGLVVYPHKGVGAVDGSCNIAVQIIQTV